MDERELVSLYYGADVTESDAQQVADQIEDLYPDVEVLAEELHDQGFRFLS